VIVSDSKRHLCLLLLLLVDKRVSLANIRNILTENIVLRWMRSKRMDRLCWLLLLLLEGVKLRAILLLQCLRLVLLFSCSELLAV